MRADVVGSLRRQKETIGDIDLVATSTNPTETFNFIANLPFVKQILAKGETKITFIHNSNTQIDIEILPKENYGSLLLYLTGSKDHNIALRTLAEGKGLSLSEWGIKQDNRLITCDTESGVYKMLGMEWVPPELRENRGEVEASLRGDLPNLVEESEVRGDVHIHSNWSDGQASIAEMALAAKALGRKYIAISDHTVGLGIANGLNEEEMQNRQTEIEEANKAVRGIAILSGLEVNILSNGELDISDQVLAQIDVVTASVHGALRQSQEQITERFMKAMDNPNVDIIGHPSGRLINERPESTIDWPSFFRKAVETNTAIEINSSPYRLDLKDTLVQQARSYGVKFVITTDAHTPHELAYIKYGINVARRGWLEKSDVLNTLTLSEFLSSLK
ncbi:MAG: DNA polymerase/3'-5' exonuclease PolX [bacterium ADurb.Bin400]|nr:MAG: DNA polymerase/3'-5' exonuclease PolX [bacterium ADurb.Bin400]